MIVEQVKGDVFQSGLRHVVAGVPLENTYRRWGMGDVFLRKGWKDLCDQDAKLGDVLVTEVNGVKFYAIVCYQWGEGGWLNTPELVEAALNEIGDGIGADDVIGLVPPGYNQGQVYGADWKSIRQAIEKSTARVTLYTLR